MPNDEHSFRADGVAAALRYARSWVEASANANAAVSLPCEACGEGVVYLDGQCRACRFPTCRECAARLERRGDDCQRCARRVREARRAIADGGRRFGVEIEVEWTDAAEDWDYPDAYAIATTIEDAGVRCVNIGYTHQVTEDAWKVVSDGSLECGWEIVSPPLQWRDADQIRRVCQALEWLGAEPTANCGLHVHHDVRDIELDGMKRLLTTWMDAQGYTDRVCANYRADGQWCGRLYEPDVELALEAESVSEIANCFDRYSALNVGAWHSYGTVEMRQHESTLDPDEIMSWIAYGQGLIEAALTNTVDVSDFDAFLDALPMADPPPRNHNQPELFEDVDRFRRMLKRKAETGSTRY